MKYMKWLQELGIAPDAHGLSEERAVKLAEPLQDPGSGKIGVNRIVVHHSATETGNAACFRVLHRGVNRWSDIGYHYVIGNGSFSGDGEVEKGRTVPFRGAHAKGANQDSLGICLVGNFNEEPPSPAQLSSLGTLLQELLQRFGLGKEAITLHRLVKGSSTECPGKLLKLGKILELVGE